jgi:hypothetical protein
VPPKVARHFQKASRGHLLLKCDACLSFTFAPPKVVRKLLSDIFQKASHGHFEDAFSQYSFTILLSLKLETFSTTKNEIDAQFAADKKNCQKS